MNRHKLETAKLKALSTIKMIRDIDYNDINRDTVDSIAIDFNNLIPEIWNEANADIEDTYDWNLAIDILITQCINAEPFSREAQINYDNKIKLVNRIPNYYVGLTESFEIIELDNDKEILLTALDNIIEIIESEIDYEYKAVNYWHVI